MSESLRSSRGAGNQWKTKSLKNFSSLCLNRYLTFRHGSTIKRKFSGRSITAGVEIARGRQGLGGVSRPNTREVWVGTKRGRGLKSDPRGG